MGSFGTSDLWDLSAPPRGQPLVSWDGARASSLTADLLTLARQNADALQAILGAQVLGEPRYLYLPAGRYPIGAPSAPVVSEFNADFVFPAQTTLMFGPEASLVPIRYRPGELVGRELQWHRPLDPHDPSAGTVLSPRDPLVPESERGKVRIEFQGAIEANVASIFDAYVDAPEANTTLREAGRIVFARDRIRELYPEWWGAVPLPEEDDPLTPAKIRRTTAALQACLDAALPQRGALTRERALTPDKLRSVLPVVLLNDYLIDRPLRVGMSVTQAGGPVEQLTTARLQHVERAEIERGNAAPPRGVVIRGECGPATRRRGAAMIKAAEGFASAAEGAQGREVSSLLVLRTAHGVTVENVVFDAAERAERCVTVQVPGANGNTGAAHHSGFEGCEFRNAQWVLVRVGGEEPPRMNLQARMDGLLVSIATDPMLFTSGGTDASNMRFTRCRFSTGTYKAMAARPPPSQGDPAKAGVWRHGLVLRASESFGVELHGCVFDGPGNPMLLALGGRFSVQSCAFRTDLVPYSGEPSTRLVPAHHDLRRCNGTDIYLGAPFGEQEVGRAIAPIGIAAPTFTACNVTSSSRQFLSVYPDDLRVSPLGVDGSSSVTLVGVSHRNSFASGRSAEAPRPAVYWAGPRIRNTTLLLTGCRFGGSGIAGGVFVGGGNQNAPVIDLGSRRSDGGEVFQAPSMVGTIPDVARLGATVNASGALVGGSRR